MGYRTLRALAASAAALVVVAVGLFWYVRTVDARPTFGKALDRPTRHEVLARLRGPEPRKLRRKPADILRQERATR